MSIWGSIVKLFTEEKQTVPKQIVEEPVVTLKNATESEKTVLSVSDGDETKSDQNAKREIISSHLTGLNYEGRKKILKGIISEYKSLDLFNELYEGKNNRDIKGDGIYDSKIWELNSAYIYDVTLRAEPDNAYDENAIQVIYEDQIIGYVPKEAAIKIHSKTSDVGKISVHTEVKGGKYKFLTMDEHGNDKVRIESTDYNLDLDFFIDVD